MSQKSTGDSPTTVLGCAIVTVRGFLGLAMVAGLLDCLVLFTVQFVPSWATAANEVYNPLRGLMGFLHLAIAPRVSGVDIAPVVGAVLIVLCRQALESLLAPSTSEGSSEKGSSRDASSGGAAAKALRAPAASLGPQKAGGAGPMFGVPKKNRMDVLRELASLKKQLESGTAEDPKAARARVQELREELDAQKKVLAFVAIDVVGSTKMKTGEKTAAIVEHAFLAFREWVDGIMKQHGLWKSSWTPDGVMAAFPDLNEAAAASREILSGLARFNKEGHEMREPFQIRVGLSQGEVLFDDGAKMDEVSAQVIDLAGHLQKYAPPNTLLIAKRDHEKLRDRKGYRSSSQRVDGLDTLEWAR